MRFTREEIQQRIAAAGGRMTKLGLLQGGAGTTRIQIMSATETQILHDHEHIPGKPEWFTQAFLRVSKLGVSSFDSEKLAQFHEHIAAQIRAGNIDVIKQRISPLVDASDQSGARSIDMYIEYKFANGEPELVIGRQG